MFLNVPTNFLSSSIQVKRRVTTTLVNRGVGSAFASVPDQSWDKNLVCVEAFEHLLQSGHKCCPAY